MWKKVEKQWKIVANSKKMWINVENGRGKWRSMKMSEE